MSDSTNQTPVTSQLGVGHLLLWTAGCAVALTVDRAFSSFLARPEPLSFARQATQIGSAAVYGAALAILAIFIWHGLRRRVAGQAAARPEPGHWLLLVACVGALLDFGTHLAAQAWYGDVGLRPSHEHWLKGQLTYFACAALAASVVLAVARSERRWLACYVAIILLCAVLLATHLFLIAPSIYSDDMVSLSMLLMALSSSLCAGMGMSAVAGDLQQGVSRDWLHWTGVAAALGLVLLQWVQYFAWIWSD